MAILPIGFFAPLPLAIMIPFMAAQSFAMGHAFGTSFQYGKRKISSMSNDEFNALNVTYLHDTLQADIRAMIPSMNESFHRMESFQIEIIQSMLNTMIKAGDAFVQFIRGEGATTITNQLGLTTDEPGHEDLQGFPEFIPHAHAEDSTFTPTPTTTSKQSAIEKYASRWITPPSHANFNNIKLNEALYLLRQMSAGNLPNHKFARSGLVRKLEQLQPPKVTEESVKSKINLTSTGIVNQIATMFNTISFLVKNAGRLTKNNIQKWNKILRVIKQYNRFVQANGHRNKTIHTSKTMNLGIIIPRYN